MADAIVLEVLRKFKLQLLFWQDQHKSGPISWPAFGLDETTMIVDDLFAYSQSDTRTLVLRGIQPLK